MRQPGSGSSMPLVLCPGRRVVSPGSAWGVKEVSTSDHKGNSVMLERSRVGSSLMEKPMATTLATISKTQTEAFDSTVHLIHGCSYMSAETQMGLRMAPGRDPRVGPMPTVTSDSFLVTVHAG